MLLLTSTRKASKPKRNRQILAVLDFLFLCNKLMSVTLNLPFYSDDKEESQYHCTVISSLVLLLLLLRRECALGVLLGGGRESARCSLRSPQRQWWLRCFRWREPMGCKAGRGVDQWETGVTRKTGCYWLHRRIQLVSRALIGSVPHFVFVLFCFVFSLFSFLLSGFFKYQKTKFLLGLRFRENLKGSKEKTRFLRVFGYWMINLDVGGIISY
jgi:hypothetical protein